MPYIPVNRRNELINASGEEALQTAGELNFAFTLFITDYIKTKGLNYQTINDIVGALEGAKLEFYRRIAIPYENTKLTENGDVYN